jgi:predicted  nucleic acid-binding Zn-ribbon protein
MSTPLPTVFREIHRLRRHLRDLQAELDRLPITLKARQAKVAKQEQALKDFQDGIKHLKVDIHEKEVRLKGAGQQLTKYERQLNDMTTPKEIAAKQTEIASSKALIAQLEEEILTSMGDLDERTAKVPELDAQLKKAKEELVAFEADMGERKQNLTADKKRADDELRAQEEQLPGSARDKYDRLVKAHGADALAAVVDRVCGQCRSTVTAQNVNELLLGHFLCCPSCGRALYLSE